MHILNTDGYKMIFETENILRKYIIKYLPEDKIPNNIIEKAKSNAKQNGIDNIDDYENIMEWIHLGELVDLIKSKNFTTIKQNNIKNINISDLINQRNNIMHSREISVYELDNINKICDLLVKSLLDNEFVNKWNKFITEDINKYSLPEVYIEYPCGKDFKRLIGRSESLYEITTRLECPQPLSIVGLGGLGKTALVLQLIENFMYSPKRPFDKILFMSFKNSAFDNGKVTRFEKVISNYTELINKLAFYLDVPTELRDFKQIDEAVWTAIFEQKCLLVLDNLETEIIRSNRSDFLNIADKFIRNFNKPSRLLITSRFGLGDREVKYPLISFGVDETKELVESYFDTTPLTIAKLCEKDWEWICEYSQGNPSLIIAFSNTLQASNQSVESLRLKYESKHSIEYIKLTNNKNIFLDFCFENTIESLNNNSRLFMLALCYFCSQINIYQINNELVFFLVDELDLEKNLSIKDIDINIFENIGFIQRRGSEFYYVNELIIEYVNGLPSEDDNSITKLYSTKWFGNLKNITLKINELLFDQDLTLSKILSAMYKNKFRRSNNSEYLLSAFFSDSTIDNLLYYYKNAAPEDVLRNMQLLDKINFKHKDNKRYENKMLNIILKAMIQTRELTKKGELKDFRQSYLLTYYEQLENRFEILKRNSINNETRKNIITFFNLLGTPDKALKFINDDFAKSYPKYTFEVYSRLIDDCSLDDDIRLDYINKCNEIIEIQTSLSKAMLSRFYINCSTYYFKKKNPNLSKAFSFACKLDEYDLKNNTVYANYLQSLVLRAEISFKDKKDIKTAEKFIEKYNTAIKSVNYNSIWERKKSKLNDSVKRLERGIAKSKKIF